MNFGSGVKTMKVTAGYYYYYYYRNKRFWWHNVKRLQGHLTNTKQNSTSAMQQIQTAAELSELGKLRTNSSVFASSVNYVRHLVYRPLHCVKAHC